MGELPVLEDDGSIQWESRDAALAEWDRTLGRGVIVVRTACRPGPLERLRVHLVADGSAFLAGLETEVVRLDSGLAMLRCVDGPVALPPQLLVRPGSNPFAASAAVVSPEASNPFATSTTTATPPSLPPFAAADIVVTHTDNPFATPADLGATDDEGDVMQGPAPASTVVARDEVALPEPAPPSTVIVPDDDAGLPALATSSAPVVVPSDHSEPPAPAGPDVNVNVNVNADALAPPPPSPPSETAVTTSTTRTMEPAKVTAPATPPSGASTPAPDAATTIDAAPLKAVLPPYFTGDCLRFAGPDDVKAARGYLLGFGAVLAVSDAPAPLSPVEVRLAAGAVESRRRVRVTIVQAQRGTVVVQAASREDWRGALDEIDAPPPGALPPTGAVALPRTTSSTSLSALTFPKQGTVTNPLTVPGILAMPVHRVVTDNDVKSASLPLLLRWLRTTRGIFRLDLSTDGQPAYSLIIVDGREARSTVSLTTLGRSLGHHRFTYELTEVARAPHLSHSGRVLHLIVELVRALLSQHRPEEIAAVFPHTNDPRHLRAVGSVVDALGFQGPHARLVKSSLQGDLTTLQVSRSPAGARVAWDVLVVLELFGGLAFAPGNTDEKGLPPTDVPAAAPPRDTERPAFLDKGKNLFEVLGLHWSCSPSDLSEATQRARREYGPGGVKRPRDAALADECMKRIDEAARVLLSSERRREYRQATFHMVWPRQAQLLVQQAKIAISRHDVVEAKNLLAAAQDLAPSTEAQHLLDALQLRT